MYKKLFGGLIAGVLLFSTFILLPQAAQGADIRTAKENEDIKVTDKVNDDLYVGGGNNVTIDNDVNGDVFAAGGKLTIKGKVFGDVICAGGWITIDGDVLGNVLVAGGNIELNGDIGGALFAGGGMLRVDGNIEEDVLIAGGQITINGNVGDDIRAAGGTLDIDSHVGGDVLSSAGTVTLAGSVDGDVHVSDGMVTINLDRIGGDLVFYGEEKNLNVDKNTTVGGERKVEPREKGKTVQFEGTPFFDTASLVGSMFGFIFKAAFNLLQAVGLVMLGLLIFKLAPIKSDKVLAKIGTFSESMKSFGIGCLALPIGTSILLVLFISLIGWPIAKVLLILAMLAFAIAIPYIGACIGKAILKLLGQKGSLLVELSIGILLIQLIRLIPCIGWVFYVGALLTGVGAMIRMKYEHYKEATNHKAKGKK